MTAPSIRSRLLQPSDPLRRYSGAAWPKLQRLSLRRLACHTYLWDDRASTGTGLDRWWSAKIASSGRAALRGRTGGDAYSRNALWSVGFGPWRRYRPVCGCRATTPFGWFASRAEAAALREEHARYFHPDRLPLPPIPVWWHGTWWLHKSVVVPGAAPRRRPDGNRSR